MSMDPPLDQQASGEFGQVERTRQPSSRLDVEGVTREKMLSLLKSRAGHLGYLNRLYKDVELLMQNPENYREVRVIRKDIEAAFGRCLQAYEEYCQLAIEPETKSKALDDYYSVMINRKEFDERVEEWLRKVETPASTHEQNLNTSAHHVSPSQVESGTSKSKSSKSSSRVSDRSKKAKADLLRREVQLRSLMKRQEMERQMERQIAEMRTQEHELKRRIALLKVEEEIEKAKATDGVNAGSEHPKSERKPVNTEEVGGKPLARPPLPREDLNQVRRNYSRSGLNPSAEPWCPGPPRTAASGAGLLGSQQLQHVLGKQHEALQMMARSLQQALEMPKRELLTFAANPLSYWLFVNNFEVNIAKRVRDAESRLTCLIQLCTGKAREAIKNCAIISPPEQG